MKKFKTPLRMVCAWHKKNFGFEFDMGVKDGKGVSGVTGVICKECARIEEAKMPKRARRWNLIGRFADRRRARARHAENDRLADERERVADIFVQNPKLHASIMLRGRRYIHYLLPEDYRILEDQVADQPEMRCKWN